MTTDAVNKAVATARDLPDLIEKAERVDPALAEALTGKALVASRTPWGVLLAAVIAYEASKYGLGWSEDICALVAGLGVLLGGYVMRYVSASRITGLFKAPPATSPGA